MSSNQHIKTSGGGSGTVHTQNELDINKQPPIRVRQESLYLLNNKSSANSYQLYYQLQNQRVLQKDLIAINEKEVCIYEANNNQFVDIDAALKKHLKQSLSSQQSTNGSSIVLLLADGDLILYSVKEKLINKIKGLQNQHMHGSNNENTQLYISDDAMTIVIKQQGSDSIWVWNRSKDVIQTQRQDQLSSVSPLPLPSKGSGLFRSNSFDRRLQHDKQSQQPLNDESKGSNAKALSENQIRGTWIKVFLSDVGGPFQNRHSSFFESFDLRFVRNQTAQQEFVKIIQTKLYSKQEYFGNALRQSAKQLQDEMMIIEVNTQSIRLNYADKGGSLFEASSSQNNLKSRISVIDFIGTPKSRVLITKLDHSGQLALTVLNSVHMLYCQVMFSNTVTQLSVAVKLFDQVSPDDCPPFDSKGKTNLVIDDFVWTNNDAFVILLFNSSSIAILPRLGSTIIAVYNPTIVNISQTMVDQFQHYQLPKCFNELIIPMQMHSKLQQLKHNFSQQKRILMHPYEDSFIVHDKHLCFLFRLELEPELTDLFHKDNLSFYFLRFCISLDKVASDPDILEKIPQLLTNKLPLFEFEKNAEADEEDDPGQVILTASQINPYEHGQKRMETNQSFNAEFTLDCQVVLVNLKHLLMGLRWNKDQPINYYQWLVTVINDCFFYFLKCSEPVYAFHALRLAEAYCKKALYVTETDSDLSSFQNRNNEHHSSRVDVNDFNHLKKFFEAVHNMYDYHNTKEYMAKSTSEKMSVSYNMLKKMPVRITRGGGNWRFQFSKNYALLVYYSLIQFRNYQAANFNILFLVFACYIMQRYLDQMFFHHLQKIIEVVFRNFQLKKKSDDYELFLGKSGKNFLIRPPNQIKVYQDWVKKAMKFSMEHISSLYEQENIENIMDTIIHDVSFNKEKVDKNISFLGDLSHLFSNVQHLNSGNYFKVKDNICMLSNLVTSQEGTKRRATQLNITLSLYLTIETLRVNMIEKEQKEVKVMNLMQGIQRLVISSSAQHCTNFINGHTRAFERCLSKKQNQGQQSSLQEIIKQQFECTDIEELRQLLGICYFYLNDIDKGILVLKNGNQNQLLRLLMISSTIKASLRQLESMNHDPNKKEEQHFETEEQIFQFQQKANTFQTIRRSLQLLKSCFYAMTANQKSKKEDSHISNLVWAALSFIPPNARLIIKEEIGHTALQKVSKIFKYLKQTNAFQDINMVFKKQQDHQAGHKYTLVVNLLDTLFGQEWTLISDYQNDQIMELMMQSLELSLISFISQDDKKLIFELKEGQLVLIDEPKFHKILKQQEKQKNLSTLLLKNYSKFVKILYYFNLLAKKLSIDQSLYKQINMKILDKQCAINDNEKAKYLAILIELSHFEKYQHNQVNISKAFNIMIGLLSNENQQHISDSIKLIKYSTLNRVNKQTLNVILDLAKTKDLSILVQQLENILYASQDNNHLEKRLKEYEIEIMNHINTKLDPKVQMHKGELLMISTKRLLFNTCLKVRKQFNLSFNQSYYFDKSNFDKKISNILGLSDEMLDKYLESQLKFEEKKKGEEYKEGQDSFRGRQHESIERELRQMESPIRGFSKETPQKINVPHLEMSKALMKGRQFGGEMTPKGPKRIDIQGNLNILKEGKMKMISRDKIRQLEQSNLSSSKRNESIEFDNREMNFAKIQKFTKRKNSVRRQFVLLQNIGMAEQPNNKSDNQQLQKRASHKKQFSLNPQGGINLKNQRLIEQPLYGGSKHTTLGVQSHLPPGLPKGGQQQKRQNQNTQQPQKQQIKVTKELQIIQTKEWLTQHFLKGILKDWKRQARKQRKEDPGKPKVERKQKMIKKAEGKQKSIQIKHSENQSFNLLFVKFEGNNYTVQNAKDVLKKGSQTQEHQASNLEYEQRSGTDKQFLKQQKRKIAQSGRPFEIIRVANQEESKQVQKLEEEEEKKQSPIKVKEQGSPSQEKKGHRTHKGSKFKSQQQYLNFIQKFKQISEKIEKVQKEANKLNQDYSNLI